MSAQNLIVGGIEIPLYALTDAFSQDYEELAAIAGVRMADGSLVIQRAWPTSGNYKLRTMISGGGSLPAPLDGLDRGTAYEISCAQHRAIAAVGNVITLPAGRRADTGYVPVGFASVAGELVSTAVSLVGNVATLTTVGSAQHYQVRYWPKFTGMITHKSSGDLWQAARSWTLTAEEV
jgi:hypothetical protein